MKLMYCILFVSLFIGGVANAQDWPNLARFRDANEKVKVLPADPERVVFMGNSITEGWVKTYPGYFEGHYVNRGISGQTTPQMLIRFRADVVNLKPAAVVILAGTNDIAGNTGPSTLDMIMDNLKSMADIAQSNGIKVILCSVLPAFDYPWKPGKNPVENIANLNKMIKKYADNNHLIYVDYYSAMVDSRLGMKTEYTKDGVHPTAAGYDVMAPLVEKAIHKALKKK
jgi:lysophospholipase L1-like esterase